MNKKAIMTKFLTTLLLAIIISVPMCLFTKNLYGTTQQAENNFVEFVDTIQKVAKTPDGTKQGMILIMDKNSIVYKFAENKDLVIGEITLPYSSQCQGNDCIILCRDINLQTWTCGEVIGRPLEAGEAVDPFFLWRLDEEFLTGNLNTVDIFSMPRRQAILIQKNAGKVSVSVQ